VLLAARDGTLPGCGQLISGNNIRLSAKPISGLVPSHKAICKGLEMPAKQSHVLICKDEHTPGGTAS